MITKTLDNLQPIIPLYDYHRNEPLETSTQNFENGLIYKPFKGFENYKDVSFIRGSCFVLTSAVSLYQIFQGDADSISNWFLKMGHVFLLSVNGVFVEQSGVNLGAGTTGSAICMSPIQSDGTIQLSINGYYFQIDAEYPYTCSLATEDDLADNKYQYNFYPLYNASSGLINFKAHTPDGPRFLALNNTDRQIRATGVFIDTAVQDYGFKITNFAIEESFGFNSANDWGVYYNELDEKSHNLDAALQITAEDIPTHLLVDFPLSQSVGVSAIPINMANLKTYMTPSAGPSSQIA